MSATGERRTLAPQLDLRTMAELFFRRDPGEPFPYTFIHKVNVYSKPPEDLVRGRVPAPGPDGEERQRAWYFRSPVSAGRRNRQVGGGNTFWHQPGAAGKPFRNVRLGWCMVEIGLQKQDGSAALPWELCKVYRSPAPRSTADPAETSTAAAAGAGVVHPAAGNGVSGAEGRLDDPALQGGAIPEVTGGDMPCPPAPPPVLCDYNVHSPMVARGPALLSGPAAMHGTLAIAKKSNAASMAAAVVMKLAGSSIPSAERMKEMAKLVISFDNPVVVLSPMGDTAHKILLAAWKALSCDLRKASEIDEFKNIRELHLSPLGELEHHLQCVAMTKEMNSTKRDNLVSSAERMSTIMFFEYLNELGKGTLQEWELRTIPTSGRDGWDLAAATIARELGLREMQVWKDQEIFTCDPNVCAEANPLPNLTFDEAAELGLFGAQEWELRTIPTSGRDVWDLAAATIARELGLREMQVWKDQEIFTCDPNVCAEANPLPNLTFDEAAELGLFGAQEWELRTIPTSGRDGWDLAAATIARELGLREMQVWKDQEIFTCDPNVCAEANPLPNLTFDEAAELGLFGAQEWELHTIPTSGRDGWDLAAATIARELGLREMQVWKDQEIFTCDPNVCAEANPLPNLTFDEAAELGLFGTQSIQRAMECGISVRIKNSFNPQAPGTLITKSGNTSKSILTSIALKSNITILEIKRIRTLDDSAFVEKAVSKFKHFEYLGISVDWVATNEDMWFTLVPSKLSSQELIQPALDKAVKELKEIATVDRQDRSVISLIGNPQVSLDILGKALNVLGSNNFAVEKVPRGSPKVANVSLVVRDSAAEHCVRVLHSVFFELNGRPVQVPVPVNSPPAAAGSGGKRKADDIDDHPEAPPEDLFNPTSVMRQLQPTDTKSFVPNEDLDRPLLSSNENWFQEFELSAAAPAPHEGSPLFSNEQLNPFSVSPCIEMMDDFLWEEEDLQPPRHVPKMAPKLRKLICVIPRSLKIPQEVDRVIRVHRGVSSRLWLTITIFQNSGCLGFSTDWMATSEGKLPLTLVSSKLLRQEFSQPALDEAVKELQNIAGVHRLHDRSVISLTGNAQLSPPILRKVLNALGSNPVVIEKVSRGSSKMTKVSLVVHGNVAEHYGEVLRSAFFENERPIPVDSSAPSSSGGFSQDGISQISDRVRRLAIA